MRKRVAIPLSIFLGLVFWFIVLAAIGSRMEPVQKQQVEQSETASQSVQEQEPEPQVPQPDLIEPQAPQPIVAEPQQTAIPEPGPQPSVKQARSDNILLNSTLIEAPIINALGRNIGTRAYITLPQDVLLEVVTLDDVAEFYWSFQGKEYNWVSIMCPEGTGLVFGGAGSMASYGKIDSIGRMDGDTHWIIIYDETIGTFRELEF
jgi:hypothetical protein